MITDDILEGGFADAARDAQAVFRAVLAALAEPGTLHPVGRFASPPAALSPTIGALLLTLCDQETPVFLAPAFAAAAGWLSFHAGAPVTQERAAARFAVMDTPEVDGFPLGSDAYPDRSATLIVPVRFAGTAFTLAGPGIAGTRTLALSFEPGFAALWAANRALYPRGLDLILAGEDAVAGLPRTTEVSCT